VLTIDIEPPASVTRFVIGSWLQRVITVFVIDPDEESSGELRKLSRWSTEEVSRLAYAKKLTYAGDHYKAAGMLRDLVEQEDRLVFEPRDLVPRKTEFGVFMGSEQLRNMPDGRQLRLFRGLEEGLHERSRSARISKGRKLNTEGKQREAFYLEVADEKRRAIVRSVSVDGSLFEIQIS